jgi:hypothetical protein
MDPPGGCTGHSHDDQTTEDHLGLSLRPSIDFHGVVCLNEVMAGSGRSILKLHEERMESSITLCSPDDDPELLLHIPFTEAVTVQSIAVRLLSSTVVTIQVFCDRDDLDFETARELPPASQIELLPPDHFVDGTIDYPCRPAGRFQNISSLTIFFFVASSSSSDSTTDQSNRGIEVSFVGLKGKGTGMKRRAVETLYESQGMPTDHDVPADEFGKTSNVM